MDKALLHHWRYLTMARHAEYLPSAGAPQKVKHDPYSLQALSKPASSVTSTVQEATHRCYRQHAARIVQHVIAHAFCAVLSCRGWA